jgi:hypothetical protein
MLAKLVRAGLATAQSETGKAIAVGRIRITDAGGWKTRPNQSYGVRTGLRISGGSERYQPNVRFATLSPNRYHRPLFGPRNA